MRLLTDEKRKMKKYNQYSCIAEKNYLHPVHLINIVRLAIIKNVINIHGNFSIPIS
jgi:hypothetical protein